MKERILVVDDESAIRGLLVDYFRQRGFDTFSTGSATKASEMARLFSPHLVVLDLALPDGDGMQVLTELKAEAPKMAVIILTGMGFDEDLLQEARSRGADGYVSKTLPLEQLHMEVRRAIRVYQA